MDAHFQPRQADHQRQRKAAGNGHFLSPSRQGRRQRAEQQRVDGGSEHGVAGDAGEVEFGTADTPADKYHFAGRREQRGQYQ